ncbi:MAG TPA: Dabb family protein [Herpetosiphonaceae bacterium]
MIHHLVLFRLKEDVDEATIAEHMADFAALTDEIAEIAGLDVRRDIVGRPVSCHFGLVSQFTDTDALRRYQQHPSHVAAFERLKPRLDHMLVLDYEV